MRLHASCVAFEPGAVLIQGTSGSGKSGLALELIAMGARLVSDDQVSVALADAHPVASAPATIRGLIEARGIGLLNCDPLDNVPICVVVDMDRLETQRLPIERTIQIEGVELPLLHKVESPHFAAALRQYVLGGKANR